MREKRLPTWIVLLALGPLAGIAAAQEAPSLKTEKEKLSYALGMSVGRQLALRDVTVDPAVFARGLNDALFGPRTLLTEDQANAAVAQMDAEWKRRQWDAKVKQGEESEKAGTAFLAENAQKEGVVTLPSGLQYTILKAGNGRKPSDGDTVEVNYRGTLLDGVEFDNSFRAGKPATFPLSAVIPGWREALKLMPVGSTWRLFVPPQLAYGEKGNGVTIGPYTTLVFEVELVGIK